MVRTNWRVMEGQRKLGGMANRRGDGWGGMAVMGDGQRPGVQCSASVSWEELTKSAGGGCGEAGVLGDSRSNLHTAPSLMKL
jgi:hypothetical protein